MTAAGLIKKLEHLLKDALFHLLCGVLKPADRSRVPVRPASIKSILFLRPDKLGDMIVTIPAMHAIKAEFPHIRVELLASPRNKSIVAQDPSIDAVHLYTKNILRDLPMMLRLRRKRFDLIFDPICHDSITGLLLSRIIGSASIHAAARKLKYYRFYDYCEPYQPDGEEHNIDNSLLVFRVMGIDPASINPFYPPWMSEQALSRASSFVADLPREAFRIGVNISAGSWTRTLPVETYEAIIKGISAETPTCGFVVFCVMEDRAKGEELVRRVGTSARLIPPNLSLQESSAILQEMNLFISPDTSLVHISGLMRIPTVGLYSGHMRNYHSWKPYRQRHGSVIAASPNDIHDITPAQVIEEYRRVRADSDHGQAR
ncbi:MAG: glycosyltransferase family 9 protein [Candidatus Zixiibacteriota bacterium]